MEILISCRNQDKKLIIEPKINIETELKLETKLFSGNVGAVTSIFTVKNLSDLSISLISDFDISRTVNEVIDSSYGNEYDVYIELKTLENNEWKYYKEFNYEVYKFESPKNIIIPSKKRMSYEITLFPISSLVPNSYKVRVYFVASKFCPCNNQYSNWVEFKKE